MDYSGKPNRRDFIARTSILAAGMSIGATSLHGFSNTNLSGNRKIHAFSKAMHWLNYNDMAALLAEAGFEGIDLTVRPGGHVLPENVEADLPKAVEAARKKGLAIDMIVTAIVDANDPLTERILKTASSVGVKYYRMGYLSYNDQDGIWNSLQKMKPGLKKLEALNRKYKIHGAYQNHYGRRVGGPSWDLYELLKDFDPAYIGCNYDVRHAVAEGGSTWILGLKLLAPWIKCTNLKDFHWMKTNDKWNPVTVAMGEGMVNFDEYFAVVKQFNIAGPISVHLEYPPFEKDPKQYPADEKRKLFLEAMRKDVDFVKSYLTKLGL
jgi:sugar phosphate isomerase/epimerase